MNEQKTEPYTQWGLPSGAKARLGKGGIGRLLGIRQMAHNFPPPVL